jgi:hypothetical protein
MTAGPQPLVGNFRNATVLPGRNNFDETLIDQVLNQRRALANNGTLRRGCVT